LNRGKRAPGFRGSFCLPAACQPFIALASPASVFALASPASFLALASPASFLALASPASRARFQIQPDAIALFAVHHKAEFTGTAVHKGRDLQFNQIIPD